MIALDSLALDCLSSLIVMRSSEAACRRDTASLTSHVVVRGSRVKRGFRSERMLTLAELKERPPGGKKLKGGKNEKFGFTKGLNKAELNAPNPEKMAEAAAARQAAQMAADPDAHVDDMSPEMAAAACAEIKVSRPLRFGAK